MPTPNNMAVRPSSDMSDSYSDFESAEGDEGEEGVMDEDDVQDEQDSDDDSDDDVEDEDDDDDDDEDDEDSEDDSDEDDENSSVRFVVPSLLKSGNAAKAISETKRSVVSNGVAKTSANKKLTNFDNEIIICDSETANGASNSSCSNFSAGAGSNSAGGFDPLNTDEKDPLDIDGGQEGEDEGVQTGGDDVVDLTDDDSNTKGRSAFRGDDGKLIKISLPVIKINRVSGAASTEESWKIKRKTEAALNPEGVTPNKRVRTNRQAVSYAEIEEDEVNIRKGRPPRGPAAPVQTPTKAATPKQQPKATSVRKERPMPLVRKGRRKRNDSEDSFEIMPFKRRQFKSVEVEDDETKDEMLRTSTPAPQDVDEAPTGRRQNKVRTSSEVSSTRQQRHKEVEPVRSSRQSKQEVSASSTDQSVEQRRPQRSAVKEKEQNSRLRETSDTSSRVESNVDKSLKQPENDVSVDDADVSSTSTKKRGRPRKSEQLSRHNASFETTSRDSFASPAGRRKYRRSRADNGPTFDENSSTFGFDMDESAMDYFDMDSTMDDEGSIKFPKRPQARPGPCKFSDQTFPRLTADELESARETGWQCKVCGRKLANQWSLDTHFTTVHGTRTFTCDICNKAFKRKDHLINHKRSIHLVKTKDCMLCDLSFKRKTELVAHMKARHPKSAISTAEVQPGEEVFYADDSPRKRGRKKKPIDQLSQAELDLLLSGEKVAKYNKSGKKDQSWADDSFDSITGRRKRGRPRKEVSFVVVEDKFDKVGHRRCPDCRKVFPKSANVPVHQRFWHIEHECQFCSRIFAGSKRLDRHMNDHRIKRDDGSIIFACTLCDGRFTKDVCLSRHSRDFHREEHCLACGSCIRGARRMQVHVAEHHPPEKMIRDVLIHGYDSPETFYQCSHCPRSFYEFFEAEHHFLAKHVVLGDCAEDLGTRPTNTWWSWAQMYPQLDIYSDYRVFERELINCRSSLRKKNLEQFRPAVVSRKSVPPPPETILFDEEIEEIFYQCELCEELFHDHDLLEEHLGHIHMATCFDFPDLFPNEWGFPAVKSRDNDKVFKVPADPDNTKAVAKSVEVVKDHNAASKNSEDDEKMDVDSDSSVSGDAAKLSNGLNGSKFVEEGGLSDIKHADASASPKTVESTFRDDSPNLNSQFKNSTESDESVEPKQNKEEIESANSNNVQEEKDLNPVREDVNNLGLITNKTNGSDESSFPVTEADSNLAVTAAKSKSSSIITENDNVSGLAIQNKSTSSEDPKIINKLPSSVVIHTEESLNVPAENLSPGVDENITNHTITPSLCDSAVKSNNIISDSELAEDLSEMLVKSCSGVVNNDEVAPTTNSCTKLNHSNVEDEKLLRDSTTSAIIKNQIDDEVKGFETTAASVCVDSSSSSSESDMNCMEKVVEPATTSNGIATEI